MRKQTDFLTSHPIKIRSLVKAALIEELIINQPMSVLYQHTVRCYLTMVCRDNTGQWLLGKAAKWKEVLECLREKITPLFRY